MRPPNIFFGFIVLCVAMVSLRAGHILRWEVISPAPQELKLKIDVNAASRAELALLPGIGPALSQRIVEHRDRHGPFHKLQEIDAVHGIGQKTLIRIAPYVKLTPEASRGGDTRLQDKPPIERPADRGHTR